MNKQINAADVIIIGGGIQGCATAFNLSKRGVKTILMEADYCGRHASGSNAGGVRTLGRKLPEVPLALAAAELWHRMSDLLGDDGGFRACGQLQIAEDENDVKVQRARIEKMNSLGYFHERLIDRSEVLNLIPSMSPHVMGGIWVEGDGYALPFRVVNAFKRAAESNGAIFYERSPVQGIKRTGNHWNVTTANGTFTARKIVNAAGAWSAKFAQQTGDDVPLSVRAPMLMITERVEQFASPVLGLAGRRLSFKQFENGTLLIGGGYRGVADLDTGRTALNFALLAKSAASVTKLFPGLRNIRINRCWAGIEAGMPDEIPVIGISPNEGSVVHAFGFSSHGFQLGPIVGEIVADLIMHGKSSLPIEAFAVDRFESSDNVTPS